MSILNRIDKLFMCLHAILHLCKGKRLFKALVCMIPSSVRDTDRKKNMKECLNIFKNLRKNKMRLVKDSSLTPLWDRSNVVPANIFIHRPDREQGGLRAHMLITWAQR